jgi:hypothetical protein
VTVIVAYANSYGLKVKVKVIRERDQGRVLVLQVSCLFSIRISFIIVFIAFIIIVIKYLMTSHYDDD